MGAGPSLSKIVAAASKALTPPANTPFCALLSCKVKVSLGSSTASPLVRTAIIALVSPGAKLRVPETAL